MKNSYNHENDSHLTNKPATLGLIGVILAGVILYFSLVAYWWYAQDYQYYLDSNCEESEMCRVVMFVNFYQDFLVALIVGTIFIGIAVFSLLVRSKPIAQKLVIPMASVIAITTVYFIIYYVFFSIWPQMGGPFPSKI